MWFSLWRSRNRLSLDELRYLIDQLMKVQIVNEVNKELVIEALRSIAELITYGDQHDAAYFEYFMEKQVIGEFVRILKVSRTVVVSLQLLQTLSIMIQNLKSEHAIYYMFSNEYVNHLITYSFDFQNEELLSYYISFIRAISGKLNKDTISLLVKTQNDEVVSFPLYVAAVRFAFHEESMIRTAVRALTLNIYHVGDDAVNTFLSSAPHADYFLNLVKFFRDRCVNLDLLVSKASPNHGLELVSPIFSAVDEIEDTLYYFSDVVSSGIPDVGRLIMENILRLLIFPLILPSLRTAAIDEPGLGVVTSLYVLCCILHIVKIKDLANTVAAALLCRTESTQNCEAKVNGYMLGHGSAEAAIKNASEGDQGIESDTGSLQVTVPTRGSCLPPIVVSGHDSCGKQYAPREALLSFITDGDDVQASGSLSVLATLLQTKELDESIVDALGILPQRKQHKKKLMQALVGEDSGEERLFHCDSSVVKDGICSDLDICLLKLKDYGVSCASEEVGPSPRVQRFQVLDALVNLICRSNISAETLWDGGWLLRQLLLHSEAEFNSHHHRLLEDSLHACSNRVLEETRGTWPDLLVTVSGDEWRKCKRAIEAASPKKDTKYGLLPPDKSASEEGASSDSSFTAGQRMCETVKVVPEQSFHLKFLDNTRTILFLPKVYVLLLHLHVFSLAKVLPDQPPILNQVDIPEKSRAKIAGLNPSGPKPNIEINLVDSVPCRIAFERGKERHFHFLPVSIGCSGWIVLAEELPPKSRRGILRVAAPLAGCNPRIDDKHPRWLHLRIRPSSFPFTDTAKYGPHGKVKPKALVDGRWILAFRDEDSCKYALSMILEEIKFQSCEAEKIIKPLLELGRSLE